ncbi:MAG TPA: S8 family serine peptidase [Bryobacteraceae bacterium]|nr:S8 family serine peptidase [Bryobacteraceae bacterium]
MTAEPLGVLARPGAGGQLKSQRLGTLQSQQRRVRRAIEQRRGRVLGSLSAVMNGLVVESAVSEAELQALAGVAKVYPVEVVRADLDRALPLHHVQDGWAYSAGMEGAGVRIAILDTGITPEHPGFQDPSLIPPAGFPLASSETNRALAGRKIIVARSYEDLYELDEPDSVRDRVGHGTAVAMCAAGVSNGGPFARVTGVAPKAWLGVYKVFPLDSGSARSDVLAKALDDALADGMDVVNMSLGSAMVLRLDQSVVALAVERMTRFGVVVVVSAGNSGPALASIGNYATIPSTIAVAASGTDRVFNGAVTVRGAEPLEAYASNGTAPDSPISAPARHMDADPCEALPDAGLAGRIVVAKTGSCLFETQLNNAEKAGAAALVLYPSSTRIAPGRMGVRAAKLPAVMVAYDSAMTVKAALDLDPEAPLRIAFAGVPFPSDAIRLQSFSSRGPTYDYSVIKPDIAATGYVYTAVQSTNPDGDVYDKSGYLAVSGTSFSSPIVAGAAAVLKGFRPGLTADQYRSLLINSAGPMMLASGPERVQRTGTGILHLRAAVAGTIAAYPTSLSFGIGAGTLENYDQLTLTNVGRAEDVFTLSALRYDGAPSPAFSESPGMGIAETSSIRIAPGQSKTVYVSWAAEKLAPGEYQGQILIQDTLTGASAMVPYWHAVPSNVVVNRSLVSGTPPTQARVGQAVTLYFRLTDASGIAIMDRQYLKYSGTVVAGGGTVSDLLFSTSYPNLIAVTLRLGTEPGRNTFRIAFGDLPAAEYTIEGVRTQ